MTNDLSNPMAGTDRLALLETFVRIVEAGSLSAAATLMGSTQPTISRRLQALERSLGVRLLQRDTHAMNLTDDGARCFERAKDLIARWQSFESETRGASDEPSGLLRVVAPHAFGQQQLVGPLSRYLTRYPRMSVEWLLHDRMPDFAAEGVDCAIRVGEVNDPSVVAVPLGEVPRILVAAPSLLGGRPLPKQLDELADVPWLVLRTFYRSEGQRTEMVMTHTTRGDTAQLSVRPRMSTDSLHALRHAALLGLGAAIASAWVLRDDIAQGRLLHLLPEWQAPALPVFIVYPPARFYPARQRRFIEAMRESWDEAVNGVLPSRPASKPPTSARPA